MLDSVPVRENIRASVKTAWPTTPSDNLEPLERWLAAQVGRPWDDVYAELGKIANPDSMHGVHIRQHLWDYVTTKSWINEQGQLIVTLHNGNVPNKKYMRSWVNSYMVHPLSGILEKMPGITPDPSGPYPKKARWKKEKQKRRFKIKQGIDFEKETEMTHKDFSDWPCIRTRIKSIGKGVCMDIRQGYDIFRGEIVEIRELPLKYIRPLSSVPIRQLFLKLRVSEIYTTDVLKVGQVLELKSVHHEMPAWTAFEFKRLF